MMLLDRTRLENRLGGRCRNLLQVNILRKFMNYEEAVRAQLKESDLIMTVSMDCIDLVSEGYIPMIGLVKELSLLFLMLAYQVSVSLVTGNKDQTDSLYMVAIPGCLFPACMCLWIRARHETTSRSNTAARNATDALAACVEGIVQNFGLIAGFNCRPKMIDSAAETIRLNSKADLEAMRVHLANEHFGPMNVFICIFIMVAGNLCLDGRMSIGQFLTNLEVFHLMYASWNIVYNDLLHIEKCYPALTHIVGYLNLPLDLWRRMELNRDRREINAQEREKILAGIDGLEAGAKRGLDTMDFIPLKIHEAQFTYSLQSQMSLIRSATRPNGQKDEEDPGQVTVIEMPSRQRSICSPKAGASFFTLMGPWSLDVMQGSLVAIVGRRSEGKSTLLKILGGVLLPVGGTYFTPPHLRMFYVPAEPLFIHGTLRDNLTFGLQSDDTKDGDLQRIIAVCSRLGLSKRMISHLTDDSVENWSSVLSMSEKVLLQLARALIANPEVLILAKPAMPFTDAEALEVLSALRAFVDDRGVDLL
eukprot:CAMPEP_0180668386 /NCGR_PEP_ID=MMETSP1037_2-20121125/62899_1 /TAXON_ID=632150 /ORGANISM="Azadinium spinosum, Strain 3D9" /LENGTH=531 /DNA_ID=CAMNT_0022697115 /DNA_START=145 /DNA_END=1736 /DNA_ORIENTATION=+